MRKTLSVAILTLALGCPTLAGVIHTPPAPQPPPPSNSDTNEITTSNDEPVETNDALTQIVLDMLRVWPSLL